jgi:putative ABC transport system permease protein
VLENQYINGAMGTQKQLPIPVASVLINRFGGDFKRVVLSSMTNDHILAFWEKKFTMAGNFIEPAGPELLTLHMLEGSRAGLKDPHSILLSASLSNALFAKGVDPLGQTVLMDDSLALKITGVYQDLPYNSTLRDITFWSPWDLYAAADRETRNNPQEWGDNNWQVFVQLADSICTDVWVDRDICPFCWLVSTS